VVVVEVVVDDKEKNCRGSSVLLYGGCRVGVMMNNGIEWDCIATKGGERTMLHICPMTKGREKGLRESRLDTDLGPW
jgi:hypothetical protein